MSPGTGKCIALAFVAVAAGCSDAGSSPTPTPESCEDFTGMYIPQLLASCSDTKVIGLPLGECVSQVGCELTIVTNQTTLKGTVTGGTFAVAGTIAIGSQPLQQECTGARNTSGGIDLKCIVKAGAEQKATCSVPSDLMVDPKDAASICCDYVSQSCGSGQRCSAVKPGNHDVLPVMPACVPVTGTKKLDEPCTRNSMQDFSNVGYDDCAAGLFCTGYGLEAGKGRVCRPLCLKSTDCASGRVCQWVGNDVPITGVCVPTCDLFTGGCAGATACRRYGSVDEIGAIKSMNVCEATGKKAVGQGCGSGAECVASAYCSGATRKCMAYCDDAHACADGKTCTRFGGEPAGSTLGACALE